MKITIEATPNEIKELLQAIGSSKEQQIKKDLIEDFVQKSKFTKHPESKI